VASNSRLVVTRSTHVWDLEAADPTAVDAELGAHGKWERSSVLTAAVT